MIPNNCLFLAEGMVLRTEEERVLLKREKLRVIDQKAPLIGIAGEVCQRCLPHKNDCIIELDLVHDGEDWTVALTLDEKQLQ
jgi:hypothetical protein